MEPPHLLVRSPAKSLAQGIVSHIEDQRDSIDYGRALRQWEAYTEVYKSKGWEIVEIEADDTLPDSVFVEDGVVFVPENERTGGCFVITSPGSAAREKEIVGIEEMLQQKYGQLSSTANIVRITKPGTLDGGDILKEHKSRTIYVGSSQRTNEEGIRQFTSIVESRGWKVKVIPVVKALHLKSMMTALPDGTIIGYGPLLEDTNIFPSFLAAPEPEGAAVVFLDQDATQAKTLLITSSAPKTSAILQARGYKVESVDVSEFEKLEGCVTCLSVRVRS